MRSSIRRFTSALLLASAYLVSGLGPACAADTTTAVSTPDANVLVSNEAPPGLKEYMSSQTSPPPGERIALVALLLVWIGGGIAASYLMTKRTAEFDGVASNAYLRWVRDRDLGRRRE